jgi:hypothetical protein
VAEAFDRAARKKRIDVMSPAWNPPAHQNGVPSLSSPLASGTMRSVPGRPTNGSCRTHLASRAWLQLDGLRQPEQRRVTADRLRRGYQPCGDSRDAWRDEARVRAR